MQTQHIKWNTGRTYTNHGQRLAAIVVHPNSVFVVDIDRGLSFYLPDCQLDRNAIMRRYDSNSKMEHWPRQMDLDKFVALKSWLETYAAEA